MRFKNCILRFNKSANKYPVHELTMSRKLTVRSFGYHPVEISLCNFIKA